jgi:hypothetical protein
MPSGQQQGAMQVRGSGNQWHVVSLDSGGSAVVLAGPFDTQALAQKYIAVPF